jgi:hypothetical protein
METDATLNSIEADMLSRLDPFIKSGRIPVRITETNPLRVAEYEALEERAKNDEEYAYYLSTWENDLISRMSIIDEGRVDGNDEIEQASFHDMPPADFILRYYIREYEDEFEVTPQQASLMSISHAVH